MCRHGWCSWKVPQTSVPLLVRSYENHTQYKICWGREVAPKEITHVIGPLVVPEIHGMVLNLYTPKVKADFRISSTWMLRYIHHWSEIQVVLAISSFAYIYIVGHNSNKLKQNLRHRARFAGRHGAASPHSLGAAGATHTAHQVVATRRRYVGWYSYIKAENHRMSACNHRRFWTHLSIPTCQRFRC